MPPRGLDARGCSGSDDLRPFTLFISPSETPGVDVLFVSGVVMLFGVSIALFAWRSYWVERGKAQIVGMVVVWWLLALGAAASIGVGLVPSNTVSGWELLIPAGLGVCAVLASLAPRTTAALLIATFIILVELARRSDVGDDEPMAAGLTFFFFSPALLTAAILLLASTGKRRGQHQPARAPAPKSDGSS